MSHRQAVIRITNVHKVTVPILGSKELRKLLHIRYLELTTQKYLPSYQFLGIPNKVIYVHSASTLFILTSYNVIYQCTSIR